LSGAFQVIFDGTNIGGGIYTGNDFYIDAKSVSYSGINGGNGLGIDFRIRMINQSGSDATDNNTTASFGELKATSYLTGIQSPSIATLNVWSGS